MVEDSSGGRREHPSPSALSEPAPLHWRVILDPALTGGENMARDHALASCVVPGEGVFRLYGWDPPTVSFGRNEPAKGIYSETEAEAEGVAYVRRPTGGRAVLHHRELTYALVFPLGTFGGLRKAYRLINKGLLTGLERLGAAVQLAAKTGPSLPPDAGPCFRQPAEGEVTALGRKLIGSAQVRMDESVLQHGSIILDGNQDVLRRLRGDDEPVPPPATLASVLGVVPDRAALALALEEGLASTFGGDWIPGEYRENEKMAARDLLSHYEGAGWTWRV